MASKNNYPLLKNQNDVGVISSKTSVADKAVSSAAISLLKGSSGETSNQNFYKSSQLQYDNTQSWCEAKEA